MTQLRKSLAYLFPVLGVTALALAAPPLDECTGCELNLLDMGGQPGGPNGDVLAEGNFDCNHGGNCHLTAALVADNPGAGPAACALASVGGGCTTGCEGSWTLKLNATNPSGSGCGSGLELESTTQAGGGTPSTTTTPWGSAVGAWPSAGSGNYNLQCGGDGLKVSFDIDIREAGTGGQPGCRNSTQLNKPEISMQIEIQCSACSPAQ